MTADLFGEPEAAPERKEIDWYNMTARRVYGLPTEWRWFAIESVGGGVLMTGAVPTGVKKSGAPIWPKGRGDRYVVTDAQRDETRAMWERDEGKCAECYGTGQRWCGWSRDAGDKYTTCERCAKKAAA